VWWPSAERVRAAVTTPGIGFIEQTEQLGTGHALLVGAMRFRISMATW